MSVVEPGSAGTGLIGRVMLILFRPGQAWRAIDAEPTGVADLYRNYVAPLAAIPAVCSLLGALAFGGPRVAGIGIRQGPLASLAGAATSYVLTLIGVFLLALVIDALAPSFGGQRNRVQAFKLAAYSGAGLWVAGLFKLYPELGWLAAVLGALYSLYLLFLGLPRLMKTAQERALPYFALLLVAAVILAMIVSAATSRVRELGGPLSTAILQAPARA
ncbi:Yip1 family protein [Phenylobacterium sp.]|uniref:Yip1 family protein n=1 Tax=Phenylobacterium sp. TaxID=1871053 RepID=UPI00398324B2